MKTHTILLLLFVFLFFNCKRVLYNASLEKFGVFKDEIKLKKIYKDDKTVVFFPIAHLGTKLFYEDVKNKVDSLKESGYYFYYERVKVNKIDTLMYRKFRKVTTLPYLRNGYKGWIDSIKNVKLKKELINQPSYNSLGLDSMNSKNVDVFLEDMIIYYEENFNEIKLEPCDFGTTIYEESLCKNMKKDKVFKEEVILNYRNNHVVMEVENKIHKKIAIIYGADHFFGIKKQLLSLGYN